MAISYSPTTINGKAAQPIMGELFFKNRTLGDSYVSFEDNVKNNTIFTENDNTVALQAYVATAPSSSGTIALTDTLITPVKIMSYHEFNPETLRPSRFNQDMAAGAWNILSNEFEQKVLSNFAEQISTAAEVCFWNGVKSATNTTIQAYTASVTNYSNFQTWSGTYSTSSLFDGVVAKLIVDHTCYNVTATASITSTNIATEYARLYTKMDSLLTDAFEAPVIFAPKSHKQLINIYNANATYRDLFSKNADKIYYNGLEIRFVPLAENVMIISLPSYIKWCTDLESDFNYITIDKIANNREDRFLKVVFTLDSFHINKKNATLYI